jgi:hypothetical protein
MASSMTDLIESTKQKWVASNRMALSLRTEVKNMETELERKRMELGRLEKESSALNQALTALAGATKNGTAILDRAKHDTTGEVDSRIERSAHKLINYMREKGKDMLVADLYKNGVMAATTVENVARFYWTQIEIRYIAGGEAGVNGFHGKRPVVHLLTPAEKLAKEAEAHGTERKAETVTIAAVAATVAPTDERTDITNAVHALTRMGNGTAAT